MKNRNLFKFFLMSLFTFFMIGQICTLTSFADEGEGWIEVQVTVPENFNDQIYIQFQEKGNIYEAFYDNFVQILPENDYTGRIKLPVGTYEVTCMNTYENPLIYNVELSSETEYPIVVTSDSAATLVKFICKVVPIEELPEIEGEYPQEVLEAAQQASELKAKVDNEVVIESEPVDSTTNEENLQADEKISDSVNKEPLYNIIIGLFSTITFIAIIGGVGYIFFKLKQSDE